LSRADRFVRIYMWMGIIGGAVFILVGAWALWIARTTVLLVLGALTLAASILARRKHERIVRDADTRSDDGHRPLAEALDGGGVDAGGGDEDAEGLA
jgi:hypothetical protein